MPNSSPPPVRKASSPYAASLSGEKDQKAKSKGSGRESQQVSRQPIASLGAGTPQAEVHGTGAEPVDDCAVEGTLNEDDHGQQDGVEGEPAVLG